MRCIEIQEPLLIFQCRVWLTLTWDVLKCSILADTAEPNVKININMRCIEILNDDFKRRYVKD